MSGITAQDGEALCKDTGVRDFCLDKIKLEQGDYNLNQIFCHKQPFLLTILPIQYR